MPEAIIVATPDGTITYFNPASEKLLGYAQAEVVGRNIAMLVPQQPDRRADAMKWLERWAHESDETQSRFLDLIAQTKSGKQMPVDVRVVERKLDGERRYFITFRDNTARRQEQASFKEAHLKASRILQVAEDGIISADAAQTIDVLQSEGRTDVRLPRRRGFGPPAVDVDARTLPRIAIARKSLASAPANRRRAR